MKTRQENVAAAALPAWSGGAIEKIMWTGEHFAFLDTAIARPYQSSDTDPLALTLKINTLASPRAEALQIRLVTFFFTSPPQQGRRATETN